MSRLLAQLMSWLPPSASLHALIAAIRRILLGKGWQHANAVAVLLLKLRPLLFCALYAAGQKWAAWAGCIACDITAIKLVRLLYLLFFNIASRLLTSTSVLLMHVAWKILMRRQLLLRLLTNGIGTCCEIHFIT